MSDQAIDQIRDANPIPHELPPLPIDEVWRRLEADGAQPPVHRGSRGPRSRRAWLPSVGAVMVAISATVTIGVAVLAIGLLGHDRSSLTRSSHKPAATSTTGSGRGTLPVGTAIGSQPGMTRTDPGAAILSTAKLVVQTRDPRGGLSWGMRDFQTTGGQTCVQVGRVQNGEIGVIGQDGAFSNDHRFHPISPEASRADYCAETDGNGYAFENITLDSATASGGTGMAETQFVGCGIVGAHGDPCRKADLRVLQYGLLGPDASSITYLGARGQLLTEPTTEPDGAYLIVESATKRVCRATPAGSGCGHEAGGAFSGGSPLFAGLVTAVGYRDGHVCRVPAALPAGTPAGTPEASCPVVGYVAPRTFHLTTALLTEPVTARKLPSKLVVNITFTARVAVTNDDSYYQYTLEPSPASASNCSNQTGNDTGHAYIRAGQRVILQDSIKANCSGVLQGTVAYVPNIGPGGSAYPTQFLPRHPRSIIVGHFSLTIP